MFAAHPKRTAAVLDRLLHHATVINIRGSSYRMRAHEAALEEKEVGTML